MHPWLLASLAAAFGVVWIAVAATLLWHWRGSDRPSFWTGLVFVCLLLTALLGILLPIFATVLLASWPLLLLPKRHRIGWVGKLVWFGYPVAVAALTFWWTSAGLPGRALLSVLVAVWLWVMSSSTACEDRYRPGWLGWLRGEGVTMTEAEWGACADPTPMETFLRGKASERKLRLFYCACCRRIAHLLPTEAARRCLDAAEAYADGWADAAQLDASIRASMASCQELGRQTLDAAPARPEVLREAINALGRVHRTEAEGRGGALRAAAEAWASAVSWPTYMQHLREAPTPSANDIPAMTANAQQAADALRVAERAAEHARQTALLRDVAGNPFRRTPLEASWLA